MRLLFTLAFCLFQFFAFAQTSALKGVLLNQKTQQPVAGAVISIIGNNQSALSNELGQFTFSQLTTGDYQLEIKRLGYQAQVVQAHVPQAQHAPIKIYVTPTEFALSEVVITPVKAHDEQIISNVDINLRPINNSQEILRMVPGLFIGQHAGGGKAEQIFLRGFDIDHGTDVRLTVDDMPVNMVSHAHGQGYADLHFVIPELVEAVDFKKGPYHADKGNFTTAGWVNFRTRQTLERNLVKAEMGQFDTYRVLGAFNLLGQAAKEKGQSAYLASEYNYSNSYFDHPQHFKRLNVLGKYFGKLSENTQLSVTASTFWSKWNHSGQIPDRAVESGEIGFFGSVDPTEGGETSRTNFNAEFTTVTANDHVFKNQFFYSNYNFELFSNFTFFLEDPVNGDQIKQKEGRNLFGYNGSYTSTHHLGSKQATGSVGVNYRQDITRHSELSHTLNRTQTLEQRQFGNINELNAGVYADESVQLSDRFTVNAGLRLDYLRAQYEDLLTNPITRQSADAFQFSPKLNFYYTANPSLQVYLNTGKSFHSNDARVVVPQQGKQIMPSAYGSDLGVIFKPFPRMLVNAAAWYLWLDQEFVYVGDAGVVEPSGKSRREGIDVSVRYQLTQNLYADVDVSAAKPRALGEAEGENRIPLAPTFTTTGGFTYMAPHGFNGSIRYRYLADRPANEDNSIVAEGYFVTDAQVNFTQPKYNIGLSIQNLFDTRWKETQFATESRLQNEAELVEEIHFTPGTPFQAKLSFTFFF